MIGAIGSSSLSSLAAAARGSELSLEQQRQLVALQRADREVRAHEQAHMAAGAGLVRGSSYSYEAGPDNRRYAVAGEVSIDASPGRTPEETIAKARQIRAAALAPADPSTADRQVAAAAGQMEMQAQRELAQTERTAVGSDRGAVATAAYRQVATAGEPATGFAAAA
ncbi:putative metalloprotease CJM1_0395 family protein [Azonexus sp.]|jgi:hypothetical protein|uniref:putative metalloprotease CJM1_0395 family protein n=1 Tax=Azonexus sp. TaxID=1872668 RepID=UPI00281B6D35|nr:putative metalloprotease CJM1_0395 family protein [Azonexus sp.]MDR1995204.1 hypothetical protein [Azonexus sp.]